MKRNEKTSKRIAGKASALMREANWTIDDLLDAKRSIGHAIKLLKDAKRIAASTLTQTPNRK